MLKWLKEWLFGSPAAKSVGARELSDSTSLPGVSTDPQRRIERVWIEEGCVVCGGCAVTCPAVFVLGEETTILRADAQVHFDIQRDAIEEARDCCCVDVIKIAYR
jgi:ferredoxin